MAEPLITVIVASYNGERFLRETLQSLEAQDHDSFEVVFVDDGSVDATAEIARSFPVRYLHQENAGLPAARNAGIAVARGMFVSFLDDDDIAPPDKLSVQAGYLLEHPEVGCVLGRQDWIFEEGIEPPALERDAIYGDLGGIPMASLMIRRHLLDAIGGFDPTYRYAEDRDLFVRLREHGVEVVVLPHIVLHRRLHGTNMTLAPPESHPLLRSLRAKLDRERAAEGEA